MPKTEKKKAYKYYKLIIRTRKELGPATLEALKFELWKYLGDISIVDVQAGKCSKPQMRFQGDKVVRK